MDVRVTLKPGRKGTRRLATRYGDRLVCVRYRYDKVKRKRYKTIELIVDEEAWIDGLRMPPRKAPDPTPVGPVLVRIHYREAELRETVKAAGGQWQPQERLWKLPYETVIKLGLDKRIIQFVMSNQA